MAAVKRQRQNTTFKESKFHRENKWCQFWLQKILSSKEWYCCSFSKASDVLLSWK